VIRDVRVHRADDADVVGVLRGVGEQLADFQAALAILLELERRRERGPGSALGAEAASQAIQRFERVGYNVAQGHSDWVFAPTDREMQVEVLSGWAAAARDTGDIPLSDIIAWLKRRRELVTAGRSSIRIGHVDFFALPTDTR